MVVNGNFFKLYNMMGNYRNLLSSRIILPVYQPVATMKKTIEESIGLPRKPKRPMTPYFRFMKEFRPSFTEKNPDLKLVEITKLLAQEWNKADEKTKAKFYNEYDDSLKEYEEAKVSYYSSFTDSDKLRIEQAKLEEMHVQGVKRHQKVVKSLGKPKRPASAFTMWVASLGEKRGSMKLSEWQKLMVAKWEALPAKEREVFELAAAKSMNIYKEEMKKWTEKMVRVGNYDLIRYGVQLNRKSRDKKQSTE